MIAEVTITLSDWAIRQISDIAILVGGFATGYAWRHVRVVSEIRALIVDRRRRKAHR